MYVAVKGGEKAIDNAHKLQAKKRRGSLESSELTIQQIKEQMKLAVDRVMTEGSLYDPELAALAIKQAHGDLVEAIFLLRAYRTTLSRFAFSGPIDTTKMLVSRRISASFKDIPGGQVLGPTYDYTHRLLDFTLMAESEHEVHDEQAPSNDTTRDGALSNDTSPKDNDYPRVLELLNKEGLIESAKTNASSAQLAPDLTREPLMYPASRATRLQALARGDEGFVLALGYSTQRGYGRNHPFAGEIRQGEVALTITPEELGFEIIIGDIEVSECETINQFVGTKTQAPQFTRGYGIAFGQSERKSLGMALVDRALRADEFNEEKDAPAQCEEFVLSHCDNVEANGFVSHLKLPHYVDFQSELELLRRIRNDFADSLTKQEAS